MNRRALISLVCAATLWPSLSRAEGADPWGGLEIPAQAAEALAPLVAEVPELPSALKILWANRHCRHARPQAVHVDRAAAVMIASLSPALRNGPASLSEIAVQQESRLAKLPGDVSALRYSRVNCLEMELQLSALQDDLAASGALWAARLEQAVAREPQQPVAVTQQIVLPPQQSNAPAGVVGLLRLLLPFF